MFTKPKMTDTISPLWAGSKPLSKTSYSLTTEYLQVSKENLNKYWDKDPVPKKALRQYLFAQGILEGKM